MYILQMQLELGHGNDDCLGDYGFHASVDGNRFDFQRMDDKVKDGLVLNVVWRWRDTQNSLGVRFFSFGRTIKGV